MPDGFAAKTRAARTNGFRSAILALAMIDPPFSGVPSAIA